jgi:hypothetical protein
MKHVTTFIFAVALFCSTVAFASDNFRNATFNFGQSYVNYSFGGIQIGATSGTVIGDPFSLINLGGQSATSGTVIGDPFSLVNPNGLGATTGTVIGDPFSIINTGLGATSGTVIGDPFSVQNPQSNSTDMNGLLAYMSAQPFNVPGSGMYINYNIVESTNSSTFYQNSYAGYLSATIEIVDASTGNVLDKAYALPSFAGNGEVRGEQPNYTYNIPDAFIGKVIYIRLNVTETAPVPYTSTGTSSMTYLGWSPNATGTFGKQIGNEGMVAGSTQLMGNYPNPVVNTTTISVQNTNNVSSLKVYDVLGRLVSDLTSQMPRTDGIADIMFNASQLTNGTYFYRMQSADGTVMQREMIVKK